MPAFEPYSKDVLSPNGTVIGTLHVTSYFNVDLSVEQSLTLDNESVLFNMKAALDNMPGSQIMNITLEPSAKLPPGMRDIKPLMAVNVSGHGNNWNFKQGSTKITFNVSKALLNGSSAYEGYYFVRCDGTNYQMFEAKRAENNATMAFSFASPYEGIPQDGRVITLIAILPEKASTVTIPAVTTQGTSGASTTTGNIPLLVTSYLVVAAIAGAVVYTVKARKK